MTKQNNLTPKEKFTAATYMGKNWDTFEGMGIKEAAAAMADVLQRPVTVSNITTIADMAGVDLSSRGLGWGRASWTV